MQFFGTILATFFRNRASLVISCCMLGSLTTIAQGRLSTWGGGQTNAPPELEGVIAGSSSLDHTMAVKPDGTVVCWGYNFDGQCDTPAGLNTVKAVAAGAFFSLALKEDGTVVAWGDNQWGQCDVPANLTNVTAISAGRAHGLALRADGTVVGWGSDIYGQINVPPQVRNARQILAEWNYSAALKADGTVVAWGVNDAGQTNVPAGLENIVFIDGNESYCLAVKANGEVVMWGKGPPPPGGLNGVIAVAAGDNHALALKSNGTVTAWGGNDSGQLDVPANLANVQAVAAAWNYSVAITGGKAALRLFNPVRNGGGFSVSLLSEPGAGYSLEYRNSMHTGTWTALPKVNGTGGQLVLTDPSTDITQRFYRVRQE